jgi:large conductance mechanosensitive channel
VRSLLTDFKDFLLKGNLVATAVALMIALVFTALVKAFVADIVTPIVAMIFGKPSFSNLTFMINGSHFLYGDFINAAITFITVAFVVFFFVVKPYSALEKRWTRDDTKACPECTMSIPLEAKRCPECTAMIAA